MPGLSFHPDVVSGSKLLPCLTTPAVNEAGRDPPKNMRGPLEPATKRRWLEGQKQYAPWHYGSTAMVLAKSGEMMTLPAEVKEQAHHFRAGVTRQQNVEPRARHRALGNSWHAGVAKFVIWLVLSQVVPAAGSRCKLGSDQGQQSPDHGPAWGGGWIPAVTGLLHAGVDSGYFLSAVMQACRSDPIPLHRGPDWPNFACMPPSNDEWEHWLLSADVQHPLLCEARVSEALRKVYDRIQAIGDILSPFRSAVLKSLSELIVKRRQSSDEWFQSLPPHVRTAYTISDNGSHVQVPVFVELLRGCGHDDVDELERELSSGLNMLGAIRPTAGWLPRTDGRYQEPIGFETFVKLNQGHIQSRLRRPRVDDEWETLLQEVLGEVQEGRMEGPFAAPVGWPCETVPVKDAPGFEVLQPCPDAQPCVGPFLSCSRALTGRGKSGGVKTIVVVITTTL